MQQLTVTEATARIPELVTIVAATREHIEFTTDGEPAAVLISTDRLNAPRETIGILSNPDDAADIREAETDIAAGRLTDAETIRTAILARRRVEDAVAYAMDNDISDLLDQAEVVRELRRAKMVTALPVDLDTMLVLESGNAPADQVSELVRHPEAAIETEVGGVALPRHEVDADAAGRLGDRAAEGGPVSAGRRTTGQPPAVGIPRHRGSRRPSLGRRSTAGLNPAGPPRLMTDAATKGARGRGDRCGGGCVHSRRKAYSARPRTTGVRHRRGRRLPAPRKSDAQ